MRASPKSKSAVRKHRYDARTGRIIATAQDYALQADPAVALIGKTILDQVDTWEDTGVDVTANLARYIEDDLQTDLAMIVAAAAADFEAEVGRK